MKNEARDVFKHINMLRGKDRCWPWTGKLAANGRPYFTVDGKKRLAYDIVRELVTGIPLPPDKMNRHTCDNKICCNPTHVIVGTHEENMLDMTSRERHGLTHHAVKAIRRALASGQTQQAIADLFGVSRENISAIATGRTYKHVKETDNDEGS
jgi:hypothetical protein